MKIQYSKFTGFDWDSLRLEELLNKLSDFLLQSGFYSDYYGFQQMGQEHNLQSLHDEIIDSISTDTKPSKIFSVLGDKAGWGSTTTATFPRALKVAGHPKPTKSAIPRNWM